MDKRELKSRIRAIWSNTFDDLEPGDDAMRSVRVRALCPCEYTWDVPLWEIVFAACQDESPLVRVEALHVIEDADTQGFNVGRGMAIFHGALKDPDPSVRHFVADVLRIRSKLKQRTANLRRAPRTTTKYLWRKAVHGELSSERSKPP
jgi:hypothetical protein